MVEGTPLLREHARKNVHRRFESVRLRQYGHIACISPIADTLQGIEPGTARTRPLERKLMATALNKELKRQVLIKDKPYTLTLGPSGLKLTLKGHRAGIELKWEDIVGGDAALAAALNASVHRDT